MISIFSGRATPAELLTNGIGALEATSCNVSETINGAYFADITIPVGSAWSEHFKFGAIIRCSTPRGDDYFRLDVPTVTLDSLTAVAWHISNDLGAPKILNQSIVSKNGADALSAILSASPDETRFSGTSNIINLKDLYMSHVSPQAAIMDTSGTCFLNTWGGEIERNKFTVNVKNHLGYDKGYRIEAGKNLLGVTETPSGNGYTNRIVPRCKYAAMDTSDLSAYKSAIDAKKSENITAANNDKSIAYVIYTQAYDVKIDASDVKRDASKAAADAQFVIDADAAKRDAAKANADSLYTQEANAATITLDGQKVAADAQCAATIAQAEQFATEAKALADKRFSTLADARKADIYLPEGYIDSPILNDWDGLKHTTHISCDTINVGEKNLDTGVITYPDEASAYAAMRDIVATMYTNGADVPGVTIDIQFADLAQTEEYKDVLALNSLDIQLGDTIRVRYYDRDLSKRVVAYVWDSIGEKYESLTIGEVPRYLSTAIRTQESSDARLFSEVSGTVLQGVSYKGAGISTADGIRIDGSEALAGGYSKFNADVMGFFAADGTMVGGMKYLNGRLASIASILTNDSTDPKGWAEIGEVANRSGIAIYRREYSTSIPAGYLTVTADGAMYLNLERSECGIYFNDTQAGMYTEHPTNGNYCNFSIDSNTNSCSIWANSGFTQIRCNATKAEMVVGNAILGVENSNVYKIIAGVKTNL